MQAPKLDCKRIKKLLLLCSRPLIHGPQNAFPSTFFATSKNISVLDSSPPRSSASYDETGLSNVSDVFSLSSDEQVQKCSSARHLACAHNGPADRLYAGWATFNQPSSVNWQLALFDGVEFLTIFLASVLLRREFFFNDEQPALLVLRYLCRSKEHAFLFGGGRQKYTKRKPRLKCYF